MRRSVLAGLAVAAAVAAAVTGGGVAAAAPAVAAAGQVVDPDAQVAQAHAEEARTGGAYSGSGRPGAKATAPAHPALRKATVADARRKADVETASGKQATTAAAQVSSVRTNADGSTTVTVYDPAPGVAPETLAGMLRAQGKPGVQVARPALRSDSGPDACQYQYANTITCPNSYWLNNGFADPQVRINDHTGSSWKVDTQVGKWYVDTPNIDMTYLWNSCPTKPGARCVDAYSGNYGNTGWIGKTTFAPHSGRAFAETGNYVQFNDWYDPAGTTSYGAFSRDSIILHGLGHVLGLGYNTYPSDVMNAGSPQSVFATGTGGQNVYLMGQVYSVDR